MRRTSFHVAVCLVATFLLAAKVNAAPRPSSQPLIPGTGTLIDYVGDDFEGPDWQYVHRLPKSSRETDGRLRRPTGFSTNGLWIEGPERGHPDHLKIVPTPEGGLEESKHALLLRTLNSGVPGSHSYDVQQDDLIANSISRISTIPVSEMPNVVVRVFLPPADQWENRTGPHFGFRTSASTLAPDKSWSLFGSSNAKTVEPYWPGLWIHFRSETSRREKEDSAFLTIRSDRMGRDFKSLAIPADQFGWWTFGMSYTGDGMVHYYAHAGVDDLTAKDHLASKYPYTYKARHFRTFFFDVCNRNDGKTWSTPFVIDDPKLYVVHASRIASLVERKKQNDARRATRQAKKVASKSVKRGRKK